MKIRDLKLSTFFIKENKINRERRKKKKRTHKIITMHRKRLVLLIYFGFVSIGLTSTVIQAEQADTTTAATITTTTTITSTTDQG